MIFNTIAAVTLAATTLVGIVPADRNLTPGAVDPTATAAMVCAPGYSASRRPNIWASLKLKAQALKLYGLSNTSHNWHIYTLDHLIPLELGGMPATLQNVWPQLKDEAKDKDLDENRLHREVCKGTMSLAEAQQFFVLHWSLPE